MTTDEKLAKIADHLAAKKAKREKVTAAISEQRKKPQPANTKDLAARVAALEAVVEQIAVNGT